MSFHFGSGGSNNVGDNTAGSFALGGAPAFSFGSSGGGGGGGAPGVPGSTRTGPTPDASSGFSFGTPAPSAPVPSTGFSFGSSMSAPVPAALAGFSFASAPTNANANANAAASEGALLSSAGTTTKSTLFDAAKVPHPSAGGSFSSSTTTTAPGAFTSSFGGSATTTFGGGDKKEDTTTASSSGFSFGPGTTAPSASSVTDTNNGIATKHKPDADKASVPFSFTGVSSSSATASFSAPTTVKGPPAFGFLGNATNTTANVPPTATITTTTAGINVFGQDSNTRALPSVESTKTSTITTANDITNNNTNQIVAATAAVSTSTATPSNGPPPPLEYQTKTVQEIINSFSEQLEKDAVEFVKQAQRVAEWDAVLRESQVGMEGLTEKVSQILFQQQEVDRTLNAISAYQEETNSTLDGLEKQLDVIFQSQSNVMPMDADREREASYQRAIEVDARLVGLQHSLHTLVKDLNSATERATVPNREENNGGPGQIVQVLNNHHDTLVWLENTTKSLERDLAVIVGHASSSSSAMQ